MASPSGGGKRVVAIFHLGDLSGPAFSLRPRLRAVARGGSLDVVVPEGGSLVESYQEIARVHVQPYEPLAVPAGPGEGFRFLRRTQQEVRLFRRMLRDLAPDLVVIVTTTLPAALTAAWLEGLPTVCYVGEFFEKGHVGGPVRALGGRALAALTERFADRLVCCSQGVAAQFSAREKVVTVYPGISQPDSEGDGRTFRLTYGLEQATPLVAVVGNIGRTRGQDTAIRALRFILNTLPEARMVFVGHALRRPLDEKFAASLYDLARALGVEKHVVFTGFLHETADVYAAADVVLNPARFNEPFGRVALEALVAGTPVVASAVGAIPEVLSHGREAILVPRDDVEAIARAVIRLAEDPALSERIVREGRQRARTFTEERGVAAFERIVAEMLPKSEQGTACQGSNPES